MASRRQTALLPSGVGEFMRRRVFELGGLILMALAVGLVLAMASFDPSDPSFNTAGGGRVKNLLGYPGAVMADLALQTFGLASSVAVVAFIAWGQAEGHVHMLDPRLRPYLGAYFLIAALVIGVAAEESIKTGKVVLIDDLLQKSGAI